MQDSFLDCGKPSPNSTSEAELGCRRTVPFQSTDGQEDKLMVELSPKRSHEPSQPLSQRAWALQEQLLSRRLVSITSKD